MKKYLSELTIEEKIDIITGDGPWKTGEAARLGIRALSLTDGPNGVRCENTASSATDRHNKHGSFKATCFPTLSLLGCTFDKALARKMGEQLAEEAAHFGVDVLLGPGINHKRVPIGGRHFEYISEDPILTSDLASEYINGLQSKGVGCSLKHFFANNTEYNRMDVNVCMDERTLQEIYLKAFRRTIEKSSPYTVMAAYVRYNGTHCAENKPLLNNILRDDLNFRGAVISDWGAVHNRVDALKAGCNIEMGFEYFSHKQDIADAVASGEISMEELDEACRHRLELAQKCTAPKYQPADFENGYKLALEVALGGMVLLKNDGVLPLKDTDFCIIGEAARTPRFQGEGSSRVEAYRVSNPLDELRKIYGDIPFAQGYLRNKPFDENVLSEAVELASKSKCALIFLDCDDYAEEESTDRKSLSLPEKHLKLIDAVSAVNKKTIVILQMGGVTEMPYIDKIQGLVQGFFAGEAVGEATAYLLSGKSNFCGRLAESYHIRYEDNPAYPYYAKEWERLVYGEGIYTGYRYYDTKGVPVRFPFGYGLSYTSFEYANFTAERENDCTRLTASVKNTGDFDGSEVVMAFVTKPGEDVPARELVGFEKCLIKRGEIAVVSIIVNDKDLTVWNENNHKFELRKGSYTFKLCDGQAREVTIAQLFI